MDGEKCRFADATDFEADGGRVLDFQKIHVTVPVQQSGGDLEAPLLRSRAPQPAAVSTGSVVINDSNESSRQMQRRVGVK